MNKEIAVIGVSSGWGAQDHRTAYGPLFLKDAFSNSKCNTLVIL
jgi:hypothetical protein